MAGIAIFWLLGFRPTATTPAGSIRKSVRFALVGVLLVSIPLIVFTVQDAIETQRQATVEQVLANEIDPSIAEIEDVVIESLNDGFVVGMTAYLYQEVDTEDTEAGQRAIERIRQQLEEAVNAPVTLRVWVVPASLGIAERPGLDIEELAP